MSKQLKLHRLKILRDALLLTTVVAVLLFAAPALTQTQTKLPGEIWVSGTVEVNGKAATTGLTVFSGYKIKTRERSGATINLGKNIGRIKLQPESELVLSFTTKTIGGELLKGQAVVTAPAGMAVNVKTRNGVVASEDRGAATIALEANPEDTTVAAVTGEAFISTPVAIERVSPGEEVTVTASAGTSRRQVGDKSLFGAAGSGVAIMSSTPGRATVAASTKRNLTANQAVCNCSFNANDGSVLNPNQVVTICHIAANGQRETLTVNCANVASHLSPEGSPRLSHINDSCGICPP